MFKLVKPSPDHIKLRAGFIDLVTRETPDMPLDQMVAVVAYMLGQMIALQDQRRWSPAQMMDLVSQNIQAGNRDAIAHHFANTAGEA